MTPVASREVQHAPAPGGLRDLLIAEGTALLGEIGVTQLSLREVARRAGVSQTAPGYHFGDRAGLLAAISANGFRELSERRLALLDGVNDAEQRLRITMLAYVRFAIERPALFHLMFGPEIADKRVHKELSQASVASFRLLTSVVSGFIAAHGILQSQTTSIAFSVWSATHGLATLLIDRQQAPDFVEQISAESQCEKLADLVIAGIRAAPKVDARVVHKNLQARAGH
jgi:AcrR family transcriptional regulator